MRKMLLVLAMAVLSGCMPVLHDYYYMSFENVRDIRVLAYGKSRIHSLMFDEAMPIAYELKRIDYSLFMDVDLESKHPSSFLSGRGLDGQKLRIEEYPGRTPCGGRTRGSSGRARWDGRNDPAIFRFYCHPRNIDFCLKSKDDRVIRIQIFDREDNLIGAENLPFEFVKNGFYNQPSAL